MGKLETKVAVITGGGSGIGRAISLQFAAEGAKVHILDLNEDGGKAVVDEILALGGQAAFNRCNVTDQQEITAIAQNIGKIDILVNNAGIAHVGNLENCQSEDFERVFNVNVKGAYNALHAIVPMMKAQGSGAILNLASIAAWVGITDRFAYSMSKGAIYAMSMSVARDYMAYGIRCNSIRLHVYIPHFVDGFIAKKLSWKRGRNVLKNYQQANQ
ncbi:2-(R)-hydroxypropyl-CoM dehydrogenase [Sphingobacterium multivorum]|uniref:2-(R)-hydroxypropyl-CoM dehydrogenase n=1 Tax=Sphingobacterium multivorum TaxID=28454 RepID=A0A2X2LRT6_SPHMU|nr:SDR family oxidoreductase [Sphingobacterium multivorum]SPZ92200.1 2-(R)-hydroxypropyl-CoM dehydrogenase [Sphingobacterium multivorum]